MKKRLQEEMEKTERADSEGFAEEGIEVVLGDAVFFVIALRLNSPVLPVGLLRHQIDAKVGPPALRPVVPQPDFAQAGPVGRGGLQHHFAHTLELRAPGVGVSGQGASEVSERAHSSLSPSLGHSKSRCGPTRATRPSGLGERWVPRRTDHPIECINNGCVGIVSDA